MIFGLSLLDEKLHGTELFCLEEGSNVDSFCVRWSYIISITYSEKNLLHANRLREGLRDRGNIDTVLRLIEELGSRLLGRNTWFNFGTMFLCANLAEGKVYSIEITESLIKHVDCFCGFL